MFIKNKKKSENNYQLNSDHYLYLKSYFFVIFAGIITVQVCGKALFAVCTSVCSLAGPLLLTVLSRLPRHDLAQQIIKSPYN